MKVQSYNVGYGPKILSFNDSQNTEFALRIIPLGGYVAFPNNLEIDEESGEVIKELDDPNLLQNRPPLQRALVISGGVLANFLLTFLLASGTALTNGIGHPTFYSGLSVTTTSTESSPAQKAGISINDIILRVNDEDIKGSETAISEFISKIRTSPNKPLILEILRNPGGMTSKDMESLRLSASGKVERISVTPVEGANGKGSIGIGINARVKEVKNIKATNLLEAAQQGVDETGRITSFTVNGLISAISSGGQNSEMGGPIAVVKAGAQMAEYSPVALIGFMASLSINLAVLNSLPFPALDGGQLFFVIAEIIAGKPVDRRVKDALTAVAFSFLLAFGASTLVGDITKIGEPSSLTAQRGSNGVRERAPPPPPKAPLPPTPTP
eukprot:CAMPEP_0119034236 /NCGR_PEP_ID=MMETSP1177-20130426/1245_1 /TAXON_ID=2985 /ORGANISM="Ochromonas sp, Strain CCMP1899" /LENGTH=383 /DNA_ID=CAMNT_0006991537 /DNA_START=465 /DNA_END=1616 /DNA_ORIENTATION=+